jgi:hypothetical protein
VFAPGHVGGLTQVLDFALVDAVVAETGRVQQRVRLLPSRVVVYFVLALALFESCGYAAVWGKLVHGLAGLGLGWPSRSALSQARRRLGVAPVRALFEAVAGPVGSAWTPGVWWRGLRVVAIDGTYLHVPESKRAGARYRRRAGGMGMLGYPLLRLTVVIECGTRAVLGAVFGSDEVGETTYAQRLLPLLRAGMVLLLDAGYDSQRLLMQVAGTGADFVCRSSARRVPLVLRELSDGSYLSVFGGTRVRMRVVEAWITVTYADGTVRREAWRLVTSLLDHRRYPAAEVVELYHRRWQAETTYDTIKSTILDGRVLRSDHSDDVDQEVYALLTVYQAIIRISVDAVDRHPGVGRAGDPARISFTVALEAARDQVVDAAEVLPAQAVLVGGIGRLVLRHLLPATRRSRAKARSRKCVTSKYSVNTGKFPQTTLTYTFNITVEIMEEGLPSRSKR